MLVMTVISRSAAVVAAALLLAPAIAPAQDAAAKGTSLVADARKALGGEEKLRLVQTLQAKGDFKRMVGQNTIEGELELLVALPDKMRRNEDLSPPGGGPAIIRTEVLNGSDSWEENSGAQPFFRRGGGGGFGGGFGGGGGRGGRQGQRQGQDQAQGQDAGQQGRRGRPPIDPEQIRQLQLRQRQADFARFTLAFLMTTKDPVTWVGTAESPDGKADVLEVKPADGAATRIFLDQSSHLPVMLTWTGFAPQLLARRGRGGDAGAAPADQPPAAADAARGDAQARPRPQPATLRMTLGDYKAVNGIKLPHLITRGVNDETTEEWTVSSYRINPSFKDDVFAKKS